jgi:hypothetical protein
MQIAKQIAAQCHSDRPAVIMLYGYWICEECYTGTERVENDSDGM